MDGAAGLAPDPALGGPVAAWVPVPAIEGVDVAGVLVALADPVRLEIVLRLAQRGESTCTALAMPQSPATLSHHMRVLRAAGLAATRVEGTGRPSRLRRAELQRRFPGLLDAVLAAAGWAGRDGPGRPWSGSMRKGWTFRLIRLLGWGGTVGRARVTYGANSTRRPREAGPTRRNARTGFGEKDNYPPGKICPWQPAYLPAGCCPSTDRRAQNDAVRWHCTCLGQARNRRSGARRLRSYGADLPGIMGVRGGVDPRPLPARTHRLVNGNSFVGNLLRLLGPSRIARGAAGGLQC